MTPPKDARERRVRTGGVELCVAEPGTPAADVILRAVVRDEAVVPVTSEARLFHAMSRFAPRALRRLARVRPPPRAANSGITS